jgi:hypothetical protein
MSDVLPPRGEWNSAVAHSLEYPAHILGPYDDADGNMHMCCEGDGDPYERPNCDFTTE